MHVCGGREKGVTSEEGCGMSKYACKSNKNVLEQLTKKCAKMKIPHTTL